MAKTKPPKRAAQPGRLLTAAELTGKVPLKKTKKAPEKPVEGLLTAAQIRATQYRIDDADFPLLAGFLRGQNRGRQLIEEQNDALRAAAIKRKSQSAEGGLKRRGHRGPIARLIERLQPSTLEEFLGMLDDSDLQEDIQDSMDILVQEIDRKKEFLFYRDGEVEKKVAFKSIRNQISKKAIPE